MHKMVLPVKLEQVFSSSFINININKYKYKYKYKYICQKRKNKDVT